MNRLKIIINLLIGKNIVIYSSWTKEVLFVIGSNTEILKKRFDYNFIRNEKFFKEKNKKIYYIKEEI